MIVRIKNIDLLLDEPQSILTSDTAAGVTTINVKNINGFTTNQILVLGFLNLQGSEIVKTSSTIAPTNGVITLASATLFPHSSTTTVVAAMYDKVEISTSPTTTGSKSVLATIAVTVNSDNTNYNDTFNNSGYYFARFYNSITSGFSGYSDAIPSSGYTQLSARSIIDSALGMINKKTSITLSDDFAFNEIDNCQMEVMREMKRWSFMQKFEANQGQITVGQWKIPMPSDIDDPNTNKSIYNFRVGTGNTLNWVDKEKWNEIIMGVAHTTLANNISVNDTTITLTDSSNFLQAGTAYVAGNYYSYTANNITTNVLTLMSASTTTNTAGQDVFVGASTGTPCYWTTYGGYIYFYPLLDSTLASSEGFLDYYTAIQRTYTDTQAIVLPDPTLVQYYLAWKMLLRINNGEPTLGCTEKFNNYVDRRDRMKKKESLNRTFQFKPLQNKFRMSSDDSAAQRTGNFNQGF